MTNLSHVTGTGPYSYAACIICPTAQLRHEQHEFQSDFKDRFLSALAFNDSMPSSGLHFNVPAGAGQLIASIRDAAGVVPEGVTVTITTPSGTVLNQPTQPSAANMVVLMQNGSLTDLVYINPPSGDWLIKIEAADTSDEFQFFISTIPTSDVEMTISNTFDGMLHPDLRDSLGANFAVSWDCRFCRIGCYVLGGLLAAAVAAGVAILTEGSAVVAAVAAFLFVTAIGALDLILNAFANISIGTILAVEYLCYWMGFCPDPAPLPNWSSLQRQVPSTVIVDSPAAVVFNTELYCFHQGGSNELKYNKKRTDESWVGDTQILTIQLTDGPSAVGFNGGLYCFHQGFASNLGKLAYTVLSGSTWSADQPIANASIASGPSAVVFNAQLYCFYQSGGQLWYSILSTDGTSWSNHQVPNTTMSASPSAVVFNGQLYCFYQGAGNNGQLHYNVLTGSSWAGDQQVSGTTMSADPSAVVFDSRLFCFYQGANSNGELHLNVLSPTGNSWSGDQFIKEPVMSHGPSAVVYESGLSGGQIYCFYQGGSNNGTLKYDVSAH